MPNLNDGRLVRVEIAIELLQELVTFGPRHAVEDVVKGLPTGAVLYDWGIDLKRRAVYMIFQHESFGQLKIGDQIPELAIHMRSIWIPDIEKYRNSDG